MGEILLDARVDLGQLNRQLGRADFSRTNRGLNNLESGGNRVRNSFSAAGGAIRAIGPAIAALGVGAAFKGIIDASVSFDSSMRGVQAVTGATGEQFTELSQLAKDLGSTTQFSASQVADAQRFLGQAGFETNEILEATGSTLALAASGGLDLANAADIASNVLSGFNLEAGETGRVADVLARAAASTNTNVQQLGDGFKFVAPTAQALGVSVEEAAAAMGVLSDAGIQGGESGTTLRRILLRLIKPTSDAAAAMSEAGIEINDAAGNFVGVEDVVRQVSEAMEQGALDTRNLAEIFGTQGVSGILALVNAGDRLGELTEDFNMAEGAAQDMADTLQSGPQGAINSLRSAFEGLQIALGDAGIVDAFTNIIELTTRFVRTLTDLVEGDISFGDIIRNVFSFGADASSTISDSADEAGRAFGTKIVEVLSNIPWADAFEYVGNIVVAVAKFAGNVVLGIAEGLLGLASEVSWSDVFSFGGDVASAVLDFAGSIASAIGQAIRDGISSAISGVFDILSFEFDDIRESISEFFSFSGQRDPELRPTASSRRASRTGSVSRATGGLVTGPGTGTSDSIPALLSNGEFVIQASAVRSLGIGALRELNQGRVPAFQTGGYVGYDEVPVGPLPGSRRSRNTGSYDEVPIGRLPGSGSGNNNNAAEVFTDDLILQLPRVREALRMTTKEAVTQGSMEAAAEPSFQDTLRESIRGSFNSGVKDAILGNGGIREVLQGVFNTIADNFAQQAADQLTDAVFNGLGGLNFGGGGGGFLGGLFGGFFQDGGIVPGSGPVPIVAHGGEVVLNRQQQRSLLEGGGNGDININVSTMDSRSFEDYVMSPRAREAIGNAVNANDRDGRIV